MTRQGSIGGLDGCVLEVQDVNKGCSRPIRLSLPDGDSGMCSGRRLSTWGSRLKGHPSRRRRVG